MRPWSGALFPVYMVPAYLAIAAYGKALLVTGLSPRWLARTHVIFGLLGAVGFLTRAGGFDPPLLIHLVPGILVVVLLACQFFTEKVPESGRANPKNAP